MAPSFLSIAVSIISNSVQNSVPEAKLIHSVAVDVTCKVMGNNCLGASPARRRFIDITIHRSANCIVNLKDFICLPDPSQSAKSKAMQM